MASSFLSFCLLFITVCTADAYWYARVRRCLFTSLELEDIEYIDSFFYNKLEFIKFNSSSGRFVGFTDLGIKNAIRWNSNASIVAAEMAEKQTYCRKNIKLWYSSILMNSVQPTVRLHSVTPPSGDHSVMLVCSAYSFYPKQIRLSWLRDGQEVGSTGTSTNEMTDGDWYYQVHSHLEYTPRSGEIISCVVEHASLREPLVTDWDPSMPESERNQIAIGASGLILGLILSLAGFIYYKINTRGWVLLSTD